MHDAIPAPIPLRHHSSPVPMAVAHVGSSALQIAARPRALIVDDCRFIAERVARTLEARGFECTIALDGLRGLEQLRGQPFDLVVLDIDLPMIDGFTLLRALRRDAMHAETPVLMLSTEPNDVDGEQALASGANGLLSKPLQLRPLTAMLDTLLSV